ncbi:hypothetical protein FGIG_06605 [Fasciola gigantica]|uniref:Chorein N-terminal domain-containing protein n=1 Tax=Fasciola gigantica TaxID=46835 RepID=A0A504Z1R0_FASGI|nr:hypothetical protein FGIG_06605 [Fasciola gigantica]
MQRYFKLETYIGKLVMSYLNTYVKLRDDQVATSLWDGDVILTHLELRCHSLDHLLPHPLRFRSGQVHELRIHIPWTKLNSENIVITLNTVECILALESSARQTTAVSTEPSVSNTNALNTVDGQEFVATEAPGYLQSYLNRLISNVRFVVQNLNIKFLQDDIVLSMSSNRVEFFPTDAQWQSGYQFDHSSANYMVHRKLQVFDITLCLDQAGPSGFVDVYEEPIIYRFHLSCLIELVFSGDSKTPGPNASTTALVTTLNVHADKLDCRISPAQMHALIRLLDVFSAIHSETVNWSVVGPCTNPRPPDLVNADAQGVEETRDDSVKQSVDSEQSDSQSPGSWASWVWSFVPSLLPPTVESSEDEGDETVSEELLANSRRSATELFRLVYEDAEKQLLDGLPYISHNASENLNPTMSDNHSVEIGQLNGFESFEKATETNKPEDRALAKQRRRRIRALKCQLGKTSLLSIGVFIDQLVVQLTDLAFQATAHGLNFISAQLGIRYLDVTPDGPGCSCGYPDVQSTSESIGDVGTADASAGQTVPIPCSAEFNDPDVQRRNSCPVPMFTFGRDRIDVPQTVPRSRSLFFSQMHNSASHVDLSSDDAFASTSSVVELPVLELDEYYSKFNDTCVRDLFPAVWFDLISVVDAEKSDIKIDELPPLRHKHTDGLRESILIRLISDSVIGNVSPSGLHRLTALIQRVNSYPAYPCCRLPLTNSDYVSMVPGQIGDHVPTQSIQLEISDLVINCYAEHVKCQAPYEHISLQTHSVQWILKSPMYPLDISNSLRLCKISRETWHDMADFIMCAECWQSGSGGAPATGHPMLLSHYLSFAFTRSRIQIDGISARVALIDTGASNELTERPLRCTPLLDVSSFSCFSWSSGCPDLWASNTEFALLSSSEFRLKMENPIQLVLGRESLPILLCLVTSLWHHAGEVCSSLKSGRGAFCSPTKTDWTDGLYLQKRHSVRFEQGKHLFVFVK